MDFWASWIPRLLLLMVLTSGLTACSVGASPASTPPTSIAAGCRLPVVVRRFDTVTHAWNADTTGFLNYPGGALAPEKASGVRYDTRRGRWLPDGIPTLDGLAYVYADVAGAVHRVALDSRVDQVIIRGAWVPLGFVGRRLYLAELRPVASPLVDDTGYTEGGIFQADLSGGKPTLVTQHGGPWWLSSLGAWTLDRADGFQQAPDRVLRLDLRSGAIETWFSGVGNAMLAGFDPAGRPFIVSGSDPIRVTLLTERGKGSNVYRGSRQAGWPGFPAYVDRGRVWFSGDGITDPTFEAPAWIYEVGIGLRPSVGVRGYKVSVAGPCR